MSFIRVTTYTVACDACGQQFIGNEGEQFEETAAAIGDTVIAYGWDYMCGQHVCNVCRHLRGVEPGDVTTKAVGV